MSTEEKTTENTAKTDLRAGKSRSPFATDPFNKRGGKGGGKFGSGNNSAVGGKKLTVKAQKRGGSGGDR